MMRGLVALSKRKGRPGRLLSGMAAKNRPHYKGVEGGVDENTTRRYYLKLARKRPLDAGALHTVLADVAWTPERAEKRKKNVDSDCIMCGPLKAG
eukprot:4369517-Heterocapsa_arctica.AAC.1